MSVIYINANWIFDGERFGKAVQRAVDNHGLSDMAEMLDVSESTVSNWANGLWKPEFPYPNMTNFLCVCNLLDLHPCIFFWVGEGS